MTRARRTAWAACSSCARETTEQVAAEQRLRDEDRRKDEFLAMLGHELRNPLAAIQNASELLVRNAASDASTRKVGELLARQVTQLGTLVDDLLDLSSITQGRIELKREPVELGSVIALALESVEPLVRAKRHKVVNTGSAAPLYVNGDLIAHRAGALECPDERHEVHGRGRPNRSDAQRARRERDDRGHATTAPASRPSCCRKSSISSCKATARSTARRAGSGSGSR